MGMLQRLIAMEQAKRQAEMQAAQFKAQQEMQPLRMEALRSEIAARNATAAGAAQQRQAQGLLSQLMATGGYQGPQQAPTAVAGSDAEALRLVQEAEARGQPLGVNVPAPANVRALTSIAFPTQFGKAQAESLFPKQSNESFPGVKAVTGGYLQRNPDGTATFVRTQIDKPAAEPAPSERVVQDTASPTGWSYEDRRTNKRTVGAPPPSGSAPPKAPTGYKYNDDGTLVPIKGGPKDTSAKDKAVAETAKTKAEVVIKKVDEALGQVGFFSTGLTGSVLGNIPGTGAYDLDRTIDTIKANVGFNELQAMRQASPTGGALGQVAVQELNMLQAVLASLEKGQSQSRIKAQLEQVKSHYTNWKNTLEQAAKESGVDQTPTDNLVFEGFKFPNKEQLDKYKKAKGL
jgi:hypothetical protein